MTVKEIVRILKKDGWKKKSQRGSHIHFVHPTKEGKVTVPNHSGDLKVGTANSILKQAGLK